MKKRRRPPRDAAVFPSAPTLVISPSEILRRKTIAANRGSANYDSVGMPLLFLYAAACGLRFALRQRAIKRVAAMLIVSKSRDVSTASIFDRSRTFAVVTGANRG